MYESLLISFLFLGYSFITARPRRCCLTQSFTILYNGHFPENLLFYRRNIFAFVSYSLSYARDKTKTRLFLSSTYVRKLEGYPFVLFSVLLKSNRPLSMY